MKRVAILTTVVLLVAMATASSRDVVSTVETNPSLTMFVSQLKTTGLEATLKQAGTWTVYGLTDRAFANLSPKDAKALLSDPGAMHLLLSHYIVEGSISRADTVSLSSARTLLGMKLRADVRSDGVRVNGAIIGKDTACTNGMVYTLDAFDPGLVKEAVRAAKPAPSH